MKRINILGAALVAMTTPPVAAWASEAHEAAEHVKNDVLPQMDVTLYPGFLFWFVTCFVAFFLVMAFIGVPAILATQGNRQKLVSDDLAAARVSSDESKQVIADYEDALAQARAQAQKTVNNIILAANNEATEQREKQAQELSHRLMVAEENIGAARVAAMKEVPHLVGTLVQDIMDKVSVTGIHGAVAGVKK